MSGTFILDVILDHKRRELVRSMAVRPPEELRTLVERAGPCRGFVDALTRGPGVKVIAEIKRASPSKGVLREDFDPVGIARAYHRGGAAALSVLTDAEFFGGSLDYLRLIREAVPLPLLRKDFVFTEYQLWESRAFGADAVLLIASCLETERLASLLTVVRSLGMDALVEVHTRCELLEAIDAGAQVVGINNRDLQTFETDMGVSERLVRDIPPDRVAVCESGVALHNVARMRKAGFEVFLVGESLMREADPGVALERLIAAAEG